MLNPRVVGPGSPSASGAVEAVYSEFYFIGPGTGLAPTKLYRAVSSAEFGGIEATGAFLTTARAFEGKQFARSFGEIMAFASRYSDVGAIMSVSVPRILMPAFERGMADPLIFRSGMITVPESGLWILNTFNYSIKHKF